MKNEVPNKGLEWTNMVLGLVLACAAFAFGGLSAAVWDAAVVGILIACCSAVALARYGAWTEWSNIVLGCWAVVAPWIMGFSGAQTAMWTHVVIGICVACIAAAQLCLVSKGPLVARN
ncbi:SPW repeat protein [Roseixanthobacter glucoisosaccharinicivorans]|uniref:SPW repeat protein n=1 Tax=Roseixanthobacter glucoisosaccharinicivorans TaxID=3119923 RepID=UPI00372B3074